MSSSVLRVVQQRMWGVEHTIPGATDFQAEIDIIERHGEIVLIESFHLPEDMPLCHQARACHCADVADDI